MSNESFKPTDEQQAIVELAKRPESLMVTAYAGCAKSTTLQLAAKGTKRAALALAFNKSIAKEMTGKLPGSFSVKTMNGLGFGAWSRRFSGVNIVLDDKKLGRLVTAVAKEQRQQLLGDSWGNCRLLVSKAMQAGLAIDDEGQPMLADTPDSWRDLARDELIHDDELEYVYDLCREVLRRSVAEAKAGVMSFDDQVYCPTILGGRWLKFPEVWVDEAQDLSPLNHRMLALSMVDDSAKLRAVGDPKQAIYAFRGADSASMERIRGLRPDGAWADAPLATTFRCPKAIVLRQQRHAPGFRAWHSNAEGRFAQLLLKKELDADGQELGGWGFAMLQEALAATGLPGQPAVLCRNNAPLLSLAFKLIRQGIGPLMLGRDIGKGLVALSRKIAKEDATPSDVFAGKLREWREKEQSLAIANGQEEKVAGIVDRAECLRAVLDSAGVKDAGQLRQCLANLFERDGGQVTLSTVHKAKGLEFPLVLHLDPWRLPSKRAKRLLQEGDPVPWQQELNLHYVCETRTKHTLLTANLEDFNG